ncbi:MAG: hypothetical protein JO338_01765 [Aquitalea sp.]|nr:hypothetical protein [Aquitalea sp.]
MSADYTMFDYRPGNKIIDGEGGSKRLVNGVEIWDYGDPAHRYRIMGMLRVSDYDHPYVNTTLLYTISQQVKHLGGNAAILLSVNGGMRRAVDGMAWHERLGYPEDDGYRVIRALVVQYLPDQTAPTTAPAVKGVR